MSGGVDRFGTAPDGTAVERVRLAGGGLEVALITWGASVQDLRLAGVDHPLVLGADRLDPYLGRMAQFGAICGRVANRIRNARFTLDGQEHRLDANILGRHTLHGGRGGTSRRNWRLAEVASDRAVLAIDLPDGDMGFPGRLSIRAVHSLPGDGTLAIDLEAETDRATPVNLVHHSYFNLDASETVEDHELRIAAGHVLALDEDLVPSGERAAVEGTRYDFRSPRPVGGAGHDINFCLSEDWEPVRPVAWLRGPRSGVGLTVETDAPGLQVHDGNGLPPGVEGAPRQGIALETQGWPDAVNRPDFPDTILRPGQTYRHRVRFRFSR